MKITTKRIVKILATIGLASSAIPIIYLSNTNNSHVNIQTKQAEAFNNNATHKSVLDLDQTYGTIASSDFYSNVNLRDALFNQLKKNKQFLEININDSVIDMAIDVDGDNDPVQFGDIRKTKFDEKNINGELAIRYTVQDNKQNITVKKLVLHGFLRNHPFLFIDESIDNAGYKIYKALTMKMSINIKNIEDASQYLINNIYFYSNYNNPIMSKFVNISKSWITNVDAKSFGITNYDFINDIMFDKNSTSLTNPFIGVVNFNVVEPLYNKTTITILSLTGGFSVIIIILLVIFYLIKGQKLKNVR